MSDLTDFWSRKRPYLAEDYSDEIGTVYCILLAEEIAGILKREGKTPELLRLRGAWVDELRIRKPLIPLAYQGQIKWGGHCVCVSEDVVYDPILESPEPLETYAVKAFGEEIEVISMDLV